MSLLFSELEHSFRCNFEEGLEQGAAVCVWHGGELVAHFCGGMADDRNPWTPETLVPIFSATKAAAASCVLLALYDCCRSPDMAVGDVWPEFPSPRLTVGELLSHQSGLAALDEPASLFDLEACRHAIEHTRPTWGPPEHGYHPHTYGPLLDILMLELTGMRIGAFWEERVRRPLGLDFYIGLPESEHGRVARLKAARLRNRMPNSEFYSAFFNPQSEVYQAFHSVIGLASAREMNTPAAWECASPAKGGVASAVGLAAFYQALLGELPSSPYPAEVLEWMSLPQCCGRDRTLLCPTSFTCGAMCEPAALFGRGGFGHAGAGGSHGFCEPASRLSFAYTMNAMELGILPGARVQRLIDAFVRDAQAAGL